jgi:GT2 family glycosyltransferase
MQPCTSLPGRRITVVVVTWQGANLLASCLDSLVAQTVDHNVLVVDNASADGSADQLRQRAGIRVIRSTENLGFAGGAQLGLEEARTEFVALLNDDAVAEPTWLAALLGAADDHPEAAAITSLLLLTGEGSPRVNNAGVVLLPSLYGADRAFGRPPSEVAEPVEVFGFSGGAALVRRDAALAVGGFPSRFFLYYEDTDLSWRLRLAGWSICYEPTAVVHHRHAASSDPTSRLFAFHNERNRLLMVARCAAFPSAMRAWGRFCITTASLGLRRLARRSGATPQNLRVPVRTSALLSAIRLLPWALQDRRKIRASRVTEVPPPLGR